MKYKVFYFNGHTEIIDKYTLEDLIYDLESFERDDVNQIQEYDENNPDELGETIWTEEEGLFVSSRRMWGDDDE